MKILGSGIMNQHKTFHDKWEAKDSKARATLLSSVDDNFLHEFELKTGLKSCGMLSMLDLVL